MKRLLLAAAALLPLLATARPLSLKLANATTLAKSKDEIIKCWANETKFKVGVLAVGKPGNAEATNTLKIVAATVVKNVRSKRTFVNDIQEFAVDPDTAAAAFNVYIATGSFEKRQDREDKSWTRGWMAEGVIAEVWSNGKLAKRLATFSGPLAKESLDVKTVRQMRLNTDCLYDEEDYRGEEDTFHNKTKFRISGRQDTAKRN